MDRVKSKTGVTICIQALHLLKGTMQLIHCHIQLVITMLAHTVKLFFYLAYVQLIGPWFWRAVPQAFLLRGAGTFCPHQG